MSLYKQLWIAVGALLLVVFGATFAINGVSSSRYLEKQLTLKNADDATRFALTLSQQSLDPILLEVQLTTLLDQGSYEYIEFRDPNGKVVFSRGNLLTEDQTPIWIKDLFPIHSLPGVAKVDSAWNQLGTLSLKSHDGFAYDELWAGGKRTLLALVVATVIAGALGTMLLRVILNPLNDVVSQAQAIGQRRFISIPEPFTTEFAEVTRSMNELSRRIREMLSRESQRLARQREASDLDHGATR
jgi:methyl-accepting chemotaxis protein